MKILILCTGNSCRSQMAEAILQTFNENIEVFSAGTEPSGEVHPLAVEIMTEWGIDIQNQYPKNADKYVSQSFEYVITVCSHAEENCPVFQGEVKNRLHIGFDDPAEAQGSKNEKMQVFRRVRNEILIDFYGFYHSEIKPKLLGKKL